MSKIQFIEIPITGVVKGQIDLDEETLELGQARLILAAEQFGNGGQDPMRQPGQSTLAGIARIHLETLVPNEDVECNSFDGVIRALRSIVYDTDMKKRRWKLWSRCGLALTWLQEQIDQQLYVITSEPGPNVEFIELEDQNGHSVGGVSYAQWEKGGKHWRLGPFLSLNPTSVQVNTEVRVEANNSTM